MVIVPLLYFESKRTKEKMMSYKKENKEAITLIRITHDGGIFNIESDIQREDINNAINDLRSSCGVADVLNVKNTTQTIHIPKHILLNNIIQVLDI